MTYRKVVILSRARSGTQLLGHSLAAPGDSRAHNRGEAFIRSPGQPFAATRVEDHVRAIFPPGRLVRPGVEQVVAVINSESVSPSIVGELARDPTVCWVVLKRDPLPRYVSLARAWRSSEWGVLQPRRDLEPIDIRPEMVERDALQGVDIYEAYRAATSDAERVVYATYEELAENWKSAVDRIAAGIGGFRSAESPPTYRQRTQRLDEAVANYGELEQLYKEAFWWTHKTT